ncbi:hypothetical protein CKM354_000796000 [Cercospora kikuchii]|uniref:FAD-binding PCMH-type domain-containing protein n=1 Tax=Cercospora kikuchii TaxID=84275 RepID=A0A9P3CL86_9PEZI|nr:uncharacterized protein CKM354_000796000 [Cercospora kikuchii]GIZ44771.1 hypothetical protein CKM354_000796000 [Cercospora kikuchii]
MSPHTQTTTETLTCTEPAVSFVVVDEIEQLCKLLTSPEIITTDSPLYEAESKTWSVGKNLHPKLVIRPDSVQSLARAIKFLAVSSLDFAVRNSGAGDASAKDVLVSTRALTSFEFDRNTEVVALGAGHIWSEYYDKMREADPEYSVVAAATPFIGVTGSTLAAGFSLMSKEFGCISDPENLLDAEVVKLDGSVIWASDEPDLLWGLRGAQLGLGVVTKLKLRARKYPRNIWGGPIVVPRFQEREVAQALASMDRSDEVAHRVFGLLLLMPQVIIVNAFDALGEEHGRKTFAPLLSIEHAQDMTRVTDLGGFASMQAPGEAGKSTKNTFWNPLALRSLTPELVMKAFDWQRQLTDAGADANVMFELWGVRGSSSGPGASAWPRSDQCRHFCMLSMGAAPNASIEDIARAVQLIKDGPVEILGTEYDESFIATSALDDYHNIEKVYGDNWERVLSVKKRYDGNAKLQSSPLARACARHMAI